MTGVRGWFTFNALGFILSCLILVSHMFLVFSCSRWDTHTSCQWTGHQKHRPHDNAAFVPDLFTEERDSFPKGRHPILVVMASQPTGDSFYKENMNTKEEQRGHCTRAARSRDKWSKFMLSRSEEATEVLVW